MDSNTGSGGGSGNDLQTTGAMAALGGVMSSVTSKWEGSKGQEVLSSVSSSLPESTKEYIESAKARLFNTAYIRSPRVFFGIGEDRPFYMEREMALLGSRLKHNFSYFYLNYFILTSVLFILTLFISPGALIGIGILGIAWGALIKATSSGSMKVVGGIEISQKQASVVMSIVSLVVLVYILSHVFWWTLATSGFFVGVHAFLRDASMHKDEEDKVQMSGEVVVEDEAFLGDDEPDVEVA